MLLRNQEARSIVRILAAVALVLLVPTSGTVETVQPRQPNIVWIVAENANLEFGAPELGDLHAQGLGRGKIRSATDSTQFHIGLSNLHVGRQTD